jgi:hypothetical protein
MLIKGIFFLGKFLGRQENAIRGIVLGTSRSMGGWVLEPKSSFARRTPGAAVLIDALWSSKSISLNNIARQAE